MAETHEGAVKPSSIEKDVYEQDLFATRIAEIPTNMKARFEWVSGNCVYAGYAPKGHDEGASGWLIQKFTYVGSDCTERNIAYGTWSGRAALTYN